MMQRFILLLIWMVCFVIVPITAQDETPPAIESTQQTLTVWIPAPLIANTDSDAYQQLLDHTAQFSFDNNVTVEYRIKAIGQMGGIMSTIRSGSVVAPGALPDVTLIRRTDLVTAQATTLLQSLENLFSSALLDDLDNSLKLGQVVRNDTLELFGLPYFIDFQNIVTNEPLEDTRKLTFDDVLAGDSLSFPAGRSNGLNQTFYLQYLAAGGVSPRNGEMVINTNALQTVLEFYETAVERDVVSPLVLEYNSPSAYRTEFINNMNGVNFAVFSFSEYLSLLQQDSSLYATNIPTDSGNTITTLNGWVWVLVTPNPSQQDLSVRYLNWMMQPEFHADLSRELNQLPAQQSAILDSLPAQVELEFVEDLLNNAILPLPDSEGGTAPRVIQEALAKVLNGESSAEQATLDVVEQFDLD